MTATDNESRETCSSTSVDAGESESAAWSDAKECRSALIGRASVASDGSAAVAIKPKMVTTGETQAL